MCNLFRIINRIRIFTSLWWISDSMTSPLSIVFSSAKLLRFVRAYEKVWSLSEWWRIGRTRGGTSTTCYEKWSHWSQLILNCHHWRIFKKRIDFFRENDEVYYIVRKTFELNNLAIAFTAAKMSTTSSSSSLGNAGRKTSAALGVKQSTRKLSARMNSEVADAFRLFDKVRIFFWLFAYVFVHCMYVHHW